MTLTAPNASRCSPQGCGPRAAFGRWQRFRWSQVRSLHGCSLLNAFPPVPPELRDLESSIMARPIGRHVLQLYSTVRL